MICWRRRLLRGLLTADDAACSLTAKASSLQRLRGRSCRDLPLFIPIHATAVAGPQSPQAVVFISSRLSMSLKESVLLGNYRHGCITIALIDGCNSSAIRSSTGSLVPKQKSASPRGKMPRGGGGGGEWWCLANAHCLARDTINSANLFYC